MHDSTIPVTWNQRLNAWDVKTIEALQERLGRSQSFPMEIAQLFAMTMQRGEHYPFDKTTTETLLSCWIMVVVGSNVPWHEYDNNSGKNFLPTIVRSNPQGVLDQLEHSVYARLKDRELSASWIAQALHVACHFDADTVAPVLNALVKTWNGDIKRSQDFANAVGELGRFFPWSSMHELHEKFHAHPMIQQAILQWNGLCTAERVYQADKVSIELKDDGPSIFKDTGIASAFHARALSLKMSGMHLARRWGAPMLVAGEEGPKDISDKARDAMERTWNMLRKAVEENNKLNDRSFLRAAASICMTYVPEKRRVFQYGAVDAILLGDTPYFNAAMDTFIAHLAQRGDCLRPSTFEASVHVDSRIIEKHGVFLSTSAKKCLQEFWERGPHGIIEEESVPLLMSYLSSDDVLKAARSQDINEQQFFWCAMTKPECLNAYVREELVKMPEVQTSILLMTLLETHGVEHWNIPKDEDNVWMHTLPVWYPDAMPVWEHVLREHTRRPETAGDAMLNAVFDVQHIPCQRWDVIKNLMDVPVIHAEPFFVRMSRRCVELGFPQTGSDLAWLTTALHSPNDAELSFPLPNLDETSSFPAVCP